MYSGRLCRRPGPACEPGPGFRVRSGVARCFPEPVHFSRATALTSDIRHRLWAQQFLWSSLYAGWNYVTAARVPAFEAHNLCLMSLVKAVAREK